MLIHENIVKQNKSQFITKIINISNYLGIDPNWLMHVIFFETAGTMSPQARNSKTQATGLLQFMPSTAIKLGTDINTLYDMNNIEQLDYVLKYLAPYKNRLKSFVDLYFAVFFPAAIDKPLDFIIQTVNLPASLIAKQNSIFDVNRDGKITVSEVEYILIKSIPESIRDLFKKKVS